MFFAPLSTLVKYVNCTLENCQMGNDYGYGNWHFSVVNLLCDDDEQIRILQIVLASVPLEVDNKRLQLWCSTEHGDSGQLVADSLTGRRQLRQLTAAAFSVTWLTVSLSTDSLPRLVQTVKNHLLLSQQSCRQVVNESHILLLDTWARIAEHLLQNIKQHSRVMSTAVRSEVVFTTPQHADTHPHHWHNYITCSNQSTH